MTAPYFSTYTGADIYIILQRAADDALEFYGFAPDYAAGDAVASRLNRNFLVDQLRRNLLDLEYNDDPDPTLLATIKDDMADLSSLLWTLTYEAGRAERKAEAAKRTEAMAALSITDDDMDALKRIMAERAAALAENAAASTHAAD